MTKYIFYVTWEKVRRPKRWWHRKKMIKSGYFYTVTGNSKEDAEASFIEEVKEGLQPDFDDSEWFLWSIREYHIGRVEN